MTAFGKCCHCAAAGTATVKVTFPVRVTNGNNDLPEDDDDFGNENKSWSWNASEPTGVRISSGVSKPYEGAYKVNLSSSGDITHGIDLLPFYPTTNGQKYYDDPTILSWTSDYYSPGNDFVGFPFISPRWKFSQQSNPPFVNNHLFIQDYSPRSFNGPSNSIAEFGPNETGSSLGSRAPVLNLPEQPNSSGHFITSNIEGFLVYGFKGLSRFGLKAKFQALRNGSPVGDITDWININPKNGQQFSIQTVELANGTSLLSWSNLFVPGNDHGIRVWFKSEGFTGDISFGFGKPEDGSLDSDADYLAQGSLSLYVTVNDDGNFGRYWQDTDEGSHSGVGSFKLTMNGGTWRPDYFDGDEFIIPGQTPESAKQVSDAFGNYMYGDWDNSSVIVGRQPNSDNFIQDFILNWGHPTAYLTFGNPNYFENNGVRTNPNLPVSGEMCFSYIPQSGSYISNWTRQVEDPTFGLTTGTFNSPSNKPGPFNITGTTTFVPWLPPTGPSNNLPNPILSSLPTSITVERLSAPS